ncbi:Glycosyltransferase, GT2 family [Flaviramulus basaltis]|uniref:Glycosyltransferase, GT2 family n=1 Tax=Flaviramulus basaltis TaxID=369401 RepID=A0A1K2IKI1_9FLAO|nr:glycosyltransferase family A protein [Flaviramulus basaltis]SFZ92932.1 Glycosyltransferase, GT2 family [Flaviramulus basaltis]
MIYLIHKNNVALKILDDKLNEIAFTIQPSITVTLFDLAKKFPEELILWCHEVYVAFINKSEISTIFHHERILASYSVSGKYYISEDIGYISQSVFVNVNREVTYPTWLMSDNIGGVSAQFLNSVSKEIKKHDNFDYFINSMAKLAMPQGLYCYSEPKLLKEKPAVLVEDQQASKCELFKFVKQHYKWVWVWILAVCYGIYARKIVLFQVFKTIFYKRLHLDIKEINLQSTKKVVAKMEIDVIIPTIGRKKYLYDVLKYLSNQTLLPKNVIIVEQNPLPESVSELDFLNTEIWPFNIKHTFTHKTGVCNARNLALSQIESEWVFLNDDDNMFDENLMETVFNKAKQYGIVAITTAYLQQGETLLFNQLHQTGIFGSGNSFVKTDYLNKVCFNMALEFGYGEDFDFGMQLRNQGVDIVYCPDIKITHLKAPFGGFRTKVKQLWDDEVIQPKPSPTIMYTFLKHYTLKQILNYKLVLFLRLIKKESIFNYSNFFKEFQNKWNASLYWAKKL